MLFVFWTSTIYSANYSADALVTEGTLVLGGSIFTGSSVMLGLLTSGLALGGLVGAAYLGSYLWDVCNSQAQTDFADIGTQISHGATTVSYTQPAINAIKTTYKNLYQNTTVPYNGRMSTYSAPIYYKLTWPFAPEIDISHIPVASDFAPFVMNNRRLTYGPDGRSLDSLTLGGTLQLSNDFPRVSIASLISSYNKTISFKGDTYRILAAFPSYHFVRGTNKLDYDYYNSYPFSSVNYLAINSLGTVIGLLEFPFAKYDSLTDSYEYTSYDRFRSLMDIPSAIGSNLSKIFLTLCPLSSSNSFGNEIFTASSFHVGLLLTGFVGKSLYAADSFTNVCYLTGYAGSNSGTAVYDAPDFIPSGRVYRGERDVLDNIDVVVVGGSTLKPWDPTYNPGVDVPDQIGLDTGTTVYVPPDVIDGSQKSFDGVPLPGSDLGFDTPDIGVLNPEGTRTGDWTLDWPSDATVPGEIAGTGEGTGIFGDTGKWILNFPILGWLYDLLAQFFAWLRNILAQILAWLESLWDAISSIPSDIALSLKNFWDGIPEVLRRILELLQAIRDYFTDFLSQISAFLPTILAFISGYTLYQSLIYHSLPTAVAAVCWCFWMCCLGIGIFRMILDR